MPLIQINNLSFAYEGNYDYVFKNITFQIDTSWKLGFIARNGRGKTTLLKLILGKYEFTGNITAPTNIEYFPFAIDHPEHTTIDIINKINNNSQSWELHRELSLLEVPQETLYRAFNTLSKGEQTKILLATLFLKDDSFLLIDEPTNHLDMHSRSLVAQYFKNKDGFLLVSHDRDFLDTCIDHVLSINKSNIEIQKGNFSSWLINKQRQDHYESAQNIKLQSEVKRLEKTAQEKAKWSDKVEKTKNSTRVSGLRPDRGFISHKAAKLMKRSKNIEKRQYKAIQEKSKLLKNLENEEPLKISQVSYHANQLLSLQNIEIFYENKKVCKNINFTINQGDRIALCGKNGCGKSSIIKLICDEPIPHHGELIKGNKLLISYVSQDTSSLSRDLKTFAMQYNIEESLFKAILRKLGFDREQFDKRIENFSNGQKKKVLIAKSLCEKAHLYIWDEPLNFIDIISRMQIQNLLIAFQPTILFVEHDRAFTNAIATKPINL